jgi:hypothetical protein
MLSHGFEAGSVIPISGKDQTMFIASNSNSCDTRPVVQESEFVVMGQNQKHVKYLETEGGHAE